MFNGYKEKSVENYDIFHSEQCLCPHLKYSVSRPWRLGQKEIVLLYARKLLLLFSRRKTLVHKKQSQGYFYIRQLLSR
jgi:hypothetical protein